MSSRFASSIDSSVRLSQGKEFEPLVRSRPLPQCQICVVIPIKNEAELLSKCLSSLVYQVDFQGKSLDFNCYEVIILANNCSDDSVTIAQHFLRQHPSFRLHIVERNFSPAEACIGRVRRTG